MALLSCGNFREMAEKVGKIFSAKRPSRSVEPSATHSRMAVKTPTDHRPATKDLVVVPEVWPVFTIARETLDVTWVRTIATWSSLNCTSLKVGR